MNGCFPQRSRTWHSALARGSFRPRAEDPILQPKPDAKPARAILARLQAKRDHALSVEVFFQVIETLAVVIGVVFAITQVRQYRQDKHREAALELMHAFQTPAFAEALNIVYNLPDGLSKDEIESQVGDRFHLVYALMTTWESLGILVFRGEVDIDMVDDFFSGPIRISWRKLQGHVMGERELLERDTIEEWFQWLYDQLAKLESATPPVPAHIQHKDWKGHSDQQW